MAQDLRNEFDICVYGFVRGKFPLDSSVFALRIGGTSRFLRNRLLSVPDKLLPVFCNFCSAFVYVQTQNISEGLVRRSKKIRRV